MIQPFAPLMFAALCSSAAPEPPSASQGVLTIECPPLAKIFCGESADPEFTGVPTVSGECDPSMPADVSYSDSIVPHDCNAERFDYFIIRTWTATDSCGNSVSCDQTIDVVRQIWDFDIKAPSCPNPFRLGSNGLISMTIAGTADHDVTQIDPTSIEIWTEHCEDGPVTPIRFNYEDKATPFPGGAECDCHTLGHDGFLDLNVHFKRRDVQDGLDLGAYPKGTFVKIFVSARLADGCGILGMDCVRIQ